MGGPKKIRMPWNLVTSLDRTLGEKGQAVDCRPPRKNGTGFKRLARVGVITLTVTCNEAGNTVKSWTWDNPASSSPAEADSTNCLLDLVHNSDNITQVLGLDFDFYKSYSAKIRDIIRQGDFTVPDPIKPGTYTTSYDCTTYWEAPETSQTLALSANYPPPSSGESSHQGFPPVPVASDWGYDLTDEEVKDWEATKPNPESSG